MVKVHAKVKLLSEEGEPTPLECVEEENDRKKILKTVRAIEMHVAVSYIAMGILQSLSIEFIGKVSSSQLRYQRTSSRERVSEDGLCIIYENIFFRPIGQKLELCITRIIQEQQTESGIYGDSLAS